MTYGGAFGGFVAWMGLAAATGAGIGWAVAMMLGGALLGWLAGRVARRKEKRV